jgi:hypothetical protein
MTVVQHTRLVAVLLLSIFGVSIPMLALVHAFPMVYTVDWTWSSSNLSLPSAAPGAAGVQSLSVGSWWILAGTYHGNITATKGGRFSTLGGTIIEDERYAQKLTVVSVNDQTIVITSSYNGTWTCTATGPGVDICEDTEIYSSQMNYTVDIALLKVTAISNSTKNCPPWHPTSNLPITEDCVGHPTSILLATNIGVGDTALRYWYMPESNATGDTIADTLWEVDRLQNISVGGVNVPVRALTHHGEHLGEWYDAAGYSKGLRKESELYDTAYGINMGWIIDGAYTDLSGSWMETSHNTAQITETNLDLQSRLPQNSTTLGWPTANVVATVAGIVVVITLALPLVKRAQRHKMSERRQFELRLPDH